MSKQLKLRRGTTAQHSTFTGASGEVTVDTTKKALVVHDGTTAGGVPLATEASLASKQASNSALSAIAANNGSHMFKNRIINGAMVIDQRNAGSSVTPANQAYGLDRWKNESTQASKFSIQQSTVAPAGFVNSMLVTSLSAYSVTSTDQFDVAQYVEGLNVADLGWGTANAAPVTLSFWVRSSLTGAFGGSLNNNAANRSYPFSYTINAANTWEQKTVTIAGDTSGTWLTSSSTGIRVNFSLGCGSTVSGTVNTWAGAAYYQPTGSTSVVSTNGATFYITGVQLEKGLTATSFDYRPYGTELALCQRYCYVISGAYYARKPIFGSASNTAIWYAQYPVPMRTAPSTFTAVNVTNATFEGYNYTTSGAMGNISNASLAEGDNFVGQVSFTFASGISSGQVGSWRWVSTPASSFIFSAEL